MSRRVLLFWGRRVRERGQVTRSHDCRPDDWYHNRHFVLINVSSETKKNNSSYYLSPVIPVPNKLMESWRGEKSKCRNRFRTRVQDTDRMKRCLRCQSNVQITMTGAIYSIDTATRMRNAATIKHSQYWHHSKKYIASNVPMEHWSADQFTANRILQFIKVVFYCQLYSTNCSSVFLR